MNFSPFSCPIFLGHPKARGRCSQGERMLYGRDLCRSGGAGKAEAAKLPGAGIGPKRCPGKGAAEKGTCRNRGGIAIRSSRPSAASVRDCLLATRHAAACVRRIPSNLINYVAVRLFMEAHWGSQLHAEIFDYV